MITALVMLLKDDDSEVRYYTAESLVKLGNASEVAIIIISELLKDNDVEVRYLPMNFGIR